MLLHSDTQFLLFTHDFPPFIHYHDVYIDMQ